MNIQFEYPLFALLFMLPAALVAYFYARKIYGKIPHVRYPSVALHASASDGSFIVLREHVLLWLCALGLALFTLAAMNPVSVQELTSVNQYGTDIVLALDASRSMSARDFQPKNRFEAAKMILEDFIKKRKTDRLGIVLFGAQAHVQAPQTAEYEPLLDILRTLQLGDVDYRRTAIGSALAVSASRLLESKAKSRIIILITDGMDTAPEALRPLSAASAIKELGIRVYAVGIGNPRFEQIDFAVLEEIARMTNGKFYRAASARDLKLIMDDIDRLEKSFISRKKYRKVGEYSIYFVWAGFLTLFFALILEVIIWPVRP